MLKEDPSEDTPELTRRWKELTKPGEYRLLNTIRKQTNPEAPINPIRSSFPRRPEHYTPKTTADHHNAATQRTCSHK